MTAAPQPARGGAVDRHPGRSRRCGRHEPAAEQTVRDAIAAAAADALNSGTASSLSC